VSAGESGHVVGISAEESEREFLRAQGVHVGSTLEVLASAHDGSVLVQSSRGRVSVAGSLAARIDVSQEAAGG
jgi:Fe2+ transport system protein FeoA